MSSSVDISNPDGFLEVWEAADVFDAIESFKRKYNRCQCVMLDPWYNKGVGGIIPNYNEFLAELIQSAAEIAEHIYVWGFPEILAHQVSRLPSSHKLTAWLTWFYKNSPSVIRGWRSAQNACLHLSSKDAHFYPENFLNPRQLELRAQGKLRYMPGPTSVIEAPLNIGFINRPEQTGHPAQKPMLVYEQLIKMVTLPGNLVFDPMCGSGTTGVVCRVLGRNAVLVDINPEYVTLTSKRLQNHVHDELLKKQIAKRHKHEEST